MLCRCWCCHKQLHSFNKLCVLITLPLIKLVSKGVLAGGGAYAIDLPKQKHTPLCRWLVLSGNYIPVRSWLSN